MRELIFTIVLVGVAALLCGQSDGSYLDSDPPGGDDGDVRIVPPPRPRGNEVTRLVGRLIVGRPHTVRNMTVFPLYVDGAADRIRYATLDEALRHSWLRIYEKGEGEVQEVLVRNSSRHHIFLMTGEIISGAKQERVIRTDTLLRPHGPEVAVPVYCVEKDRWAGRSMAFRSDSSVASSRLRSKAQSEEGQDAVWDEVDRVAESAGVTSDTSSFQDVVDDEKVRSALGEYDKCMAVPPRRCIGAAIVINNGSSEGTAYATQASHRIAGVEVFANEALFAALWPKLRRGYALDAYLPTRRNASDRIRPMRRRINSDDIRAFLDRTLEARFTRKGAVDLGVMLTIRGHGVAGESLIFGTSVVHVNFAPERYAVLHKKSVRELDRGNDSPTEGE